MKYLAALLLAFTAMTQSSGSAQAYSVTVAGSSNIYRADNLSGDGTLPPGISFEAGAGKTITFSSVTGVVGCCTSWSYVVGPDGGKGVSSWSNIVGINGLSSFQSVNGALPLVGVFTKGSRNEGPVPATQLYDLAHITFQSLFPELYQVFFIGDGVRNSDGVTQVFNVPAEATAFYLGFADASNFNGYAGAYSDNPGSLSAKFSLNLPMVTAVPEPAALGFTGLGLTALALMRRRRH